MARFMLHVMLAFTLILNGISAPSAMVRMSHGDHTDHGAHASTAAAPATAEHASHHGHAHGHDGPAAPTDREPASGGPCCDGATCQCGCVLPPVVPFAAMTLASIALVPPTFVAPAASPVPRRGTPPFRPPAL